MILKCDLCGHKIYSGDYVVCATCYNKAEFKRPRRGFKCREKKASARIVVKK